MRILLNKTQNRYIRGREKGHTESSTRNERKEGEIITQEEL